MGIIICSHCGRETFSHYRNCPKCKAPSNLRRSKRGPWLSCSKYPKCRGRLGWKTLTEEQQKDLEMALMNHEKAHHTPKLKRLDGTEIGDEYKPLPLDGDAAAGQNDADGSDAEQQ